MKYLLMLIISVSLFGCTEEIQEEFPLEKKMLVNNLQAFTENTQTDLKIRFHKFEEIKKDITYADSLTYFISFYSDEMEIQSGTFEQFKHGCDSLIYTNDTVIVLCDTALARLDELYNVYKKGWDELRKNYYYNKMKEVDGKISDIESQKEFLITERDHVSNSLEIVSNYHLKRNDIIGNLYKTNYTAFNPFLNTDQTFDRVFLINTSTGYVKRIETD